MIIKFLIKNSVLIAWSENLATRDKSASCAAAKNENS